MVRYWAAITAATLFAAGCGEFETQSIVLDLRVLAMTVDPPEVVTPFDPDNPDDIVLQDVEVCALVADPGDSRRLEYNMVACAERNSSRCDDVTAPFVDIGFGTIEDPEEAGAPVQLCQTLPANANLLAVIENAIEESALSGFGGVPVAIEFWVRPEDTGLEEAQFATKQMLYSPEFPVGRVANTNPSLIEITLEREDESTEVLPLGRCVDIADPPTVVLEEVVNFMPVEPDGVREDYLLPTFDGGSREFTENLTYAYYSTEGDWEREVTGGPRDFAGNEPPLDSEWTSLDEDADIGDGLDVQFWIVQRDERGGLAWFETCIRVVP
jgi:hypothetical protein